MVDITSKSRRRVYITPEFLLLLTAVTVLSGLELTAAVVLAAGIHEAGHLTAMRIRGGRIGSLRLTGCGAELVYSGATGYYDDAVIALAGPAASALLAGAGVWCYERALGGFFADLTAVSTVYALINMLPASVLDGGRALYAGLAWIFGPDTADRASQIIDILTLLAALAAGGYCVFAYKSVSMMICAVFLSIACCKSRGLCV